MKTKIILLVLLGLLAVSCSQDRSIPPEEWENLLASDTVDYPPQRPLYQRPLKAALLLPLTGDRAELGTALQDAGLMALNENREAPLSLWFYDTKGTAEGAKQAYEEAISQRNHIIIGPVFSSEAAAVREERPDIAVISLSSDSSVMGSDMHTFGLLIPDQMRHIARFACQSGQRKLAVIGPENKVAEQAMNSLAEEIKRCPEMELTKVSLYNPNASNLSPPILKIVPRPKPSSPKTVTSADTPTEPVEEPTLSEKIGIDAFIILEEGTKLRQLISLLSFYDVTPDDIPVYGLTSWSQVKDKALAGAYIPTLNEEAFNRFSTRYRTYFNKTPPRLASQMYDAVSFVSQLSYTPPLSNESITQSTGYSGIDGRVRLKANGTNERLLSIRQIQPNLRLKTVAPPPDDFSDPDIPFISPSPIVPEMWDFTVPSATESTYSTSTFPPASGLSDPLGTPTIPAHMP